MQLQFEQNATLATVALRGHLSASTGNAFREEMIALGSAHPDVVDWVLDMDNVDFLDSSGLGVLISLLKRVTEKKGDIVLVSLQKKVLMVFEITRALRIFRVFDTVEEASRAVRMKDAP